ncbi:AAA family ATPase [Vibrio nigripulchritudo]|uniref:AAA family ATPase n=1 Tax=Vibrio nigripulchritudo TaxID=28173 RepID=UPI00138DEF6A|nr:ATP-binding protein [Vibrio nigripulchritudo]
MTATNIRQDDSHNLFQPEGVREYVLPIAAIYGANGAGKTNFIAALSYFVNSIIYNVNRGFDDVSTPRFKLDPDYEIDETSFDMDFIVNGVHYHYGYIIDGDLITSEWLYSFSYKSRMSRTVLFHRDIDSEEEYYFSKSFKGKNKSISEITNEHSLFLSTAAKSNHETAKSIYDFIRDSFNFRFRNGKNEQLIAKKILENNLSQDISNFLSVIDIGAVKLEVNKTQVDEEQKEIRSSVRNALLSVFENKDNLDFKFGSSEEDNIDYGISISRRNIDDDIIKFNYGDESLGTRSLISLLASAFLILRNGGIFVVDELESSLHTLLSLKVVELFNNKNINKNGAQLIFTTHETQLLNFKGFRKDEAWLTEKCQNGSTNLAPLSDYSIPKKSNVRNGYLDGRFGAIPFLGLTEKFETLWEDNEG